MRRPRTWGIQWFTWFALVGLTIAAAVAGQKPKIEAAEKTFDFGTIIVGQKATHVYTLKNTGDADLAISSVTTTCGCTVAALAKKSLKPGETTDLKVTFNAGLTPSRIAKYIMIKSNDPDQPQIKLAITGKVQALVDVVPRTLSLGDLTPDSQTARTIYVKPLNKQGFNITKITSSLPYVTAEVAKGPSPDTGTCEVAVKAGPDLPVGRLFATLTILTTEAKQPKTTVHVLANVIRPPK
jgi:hypothetical protein